MSGADSGSTVRIPTSMIITTRLSRRWLPIRWPRMTCSGSGSVPRSPTTGNARSANNVVWHWSNKLAYLHFPLNGKVRGFVLKVRQGTEQGQSWGPAAMILWADKTGVRIGARSDGLLQADILGRQTCGGTNDPTQWVWLRARWLQARCR